MPKKKSDGLNLSVILQSSELKKRLLFSLFMLIMFRLGAQIPIPGIPLDLLSNNPLLTGNLVNMYDLFAGGTLKSLSIFALGIGPYISASIVIQLLTTVNPHLKGLRQEGEYGQRKIRRITRLLTLVLALAESFGLARMLTSAVVLNSLMPLPALFFVIMLTLSAATMLIMWMAELISEKGIGNGSSLLICTGIIARLPLMIRDTWFSVESGTTAPWAVAFMIAVLLMVGAVAVMLQQSLKKVPVLGGKAKRSGSGPAIDTHLYLPMNPAGVMPIVFASQCLFFIQMFVSYMANQIEHFQHLLLEDKTISPFWAAITSNSFFHSVSLTLWAEFSNIFDYAHWEYYVLYTALILFFSLFYSEIVLPPAEIAESLRKSNRALYGVKPGRPTVVFLRKTIQRLSLIGAAAVALIALLPTQVAQFTQVQTLLGFGSTSLIILTGVALDTQRQITACAQSSRYHKRYLLVPRQNNTPEEENS